MSFDTVGLYGKQDATRIAPTLDRIYRHLASRGVRVVAERDTAAALAHHQPQQSALDELGKVCDLVIAVGGDGTLLRAARAVAGHGVALVGVNLGRLGFLVDILPDEACQKLDEMLEGCYLTDERYLLRVEIIRDQAVICTQTAFNEVVVHRWMTPSMLELITSIDGVFLNSQRCDGLIVSTPTGSTAYALSAGGPIMYPALRSIILVPLNPHTLTNRPLVIDDDRVVEIRFRQERSITPQITCDDVAINDVGSGDTVRISREPRPLRLLHPCDYDYFELLRAKLNWSRDG